MSAESAPEIHLKEFDGDIEQWPLFTTANRLFQQIHTLGRFVGNPGKIEGEQFLAPLEPHECSILLNSLLGLKIIEPQTKNVIENYYRSSEIHPGAVKARVSRKKIDDHLSIELFFGGSPSSEPSELTFRINQEFHPVGDTIHYFWGNADYAYGSEKITIYQGSPILEGLNQIFEARKRIKELYEASA